MALRRIFTFSLAALVVAQLSPGAQASLFDRCLRALGGGAKGAATPADRPADASAPVNESEKPMTSSVAFDGFEIPPAVRSAGMLPRGAAIATSSGALAKTGITEIIHAASGSMTRNGPEFDPSLKGVVDSVRNALALAQARGHRRVALPFIGGKVFLEAIGLPARELVDAIVKTALANRGGLELRFVTFGDEDTGLFRASVRDHAAGVSAEAVAVAPGSITDFRVHGASVIVNAANMEAEFGGGLSGVIARATGREHEINAEARAAIAAFYRERASQ